MLILLDSEMEDFTVPSHLYSGDINDLVQKLPITVKVQHVNHHVLTLQHPEEVQTMDLAAKSMDPVKDAESQDLIAVAESIDPAEDADSQDLIEAAESMDPAEDAESQDLIEAAESMDPTKAAVSLNED